MAEGAHSGIGVSGSARPHARISLHTPEPMERREDEIPTRRHIGSAAADSMTLARAPLPFVFALGEAIFVALGVLELQWIVGFDIGGQLHGGTQGSKKFRSRSRPCEQVMAAFRATHAKLDRFQRGTDGIARET